MTDEKAAEIETVVDPDAVTEVAIDYIKAPDFRSVWVDGCVGTLTPQKLINIAIYSERMAIPLRQVFLVNETSPGRGTLGSEILEKRVSKDSIVREMACNLMLSSSTARSLAKYLIEKAAELEEIETEDENNAL